MRVVCSLDANLSKSCTFKTLPTLPMHFRQRHYSHLHIKAMALCKRNPDSMTARAHGTPLEMSPASSQSPKSISPKNKFACTMNTKTTLIIQEKSRSREPRAKRQSRLFVGHLVAISIWRSPIPRSARSIHPNQYVRVRFLFAALFASLVNIG